MQTGSDIDEGRLTHENGTKISSLIARQMETDGWTERGGRKREGRADRQTENREGLLQMTIKHAHRQGDQCIMVVHNYCQYYEEHKYIHKHETMRFYK